MCQAGKDTVNDTWFSPEGVVAVEAWVRDGPGPNEPGPGTEPLGVMRKPEAISRLARCLERAWLPTEEYSRLGLATSWYRQYLRFHYDDGRHVTYSMNANMVRTVLIRDLDRHRWGLIDEDCVQEIDTLFPFQPRSSP